MNKHKYIIILILSALLLILVASKAHAQELTLPERMVQSFIIVRTMSGVIGSGVYITDTDNTPYMLTAAHVVSSRRARTACHQDRPLGKEECVGWNWETIKVDEDLDLALIQLNRSFHLATPAPYDPTYEFTYGEDIWLVGNPASARVMISRGVLQGWIGINKLTTTAQAWMGASGGPIFNGEGMLVGIYTSSVGTTHTPPGSDTQVYEMAEGLNQFSTLETMF